MISTTSPVDSSSRKAPVAKCTAEQGQISIFFASSVIVLISIIAFIVNIGLFVKAKINLQNATDAAAYAGAATQGRMLNRIGYLNWDMRNTYKEWMYKYWVLGNLNIDQVGNPALATNNFINFGMEKDTFTSVAGGESDIYNFPSVCLQYAGVPTNVCKKYSLPGIPRFEPTNLIGIDETTSSFIDAIVREKSDDCSKRSRLNYNVATLWAYQVVDTNPSDAQNAFADAPQIAANRPGAWPVAVEQAIRVRNLENAVNRAPIAGICAGQGAGAGSCAIDIGSLSQQKHYGNERPIKAFWSGLRNLGNESDSEMKNSFTLTELSPTPVTIDNPYDLSRILTKGVSTKYYLDLKLMMVNYATFFTALISRDDRTRVEGTTVSTQGACDVSKIAIPVPGYPLGFYKNPDVLTYYAVKGQARFQGMFNPFAGATVMTAYAAAKPMGGRIGPALFTQQSPTQTTTLTARTTTEKRRSSSYILGLDLTGLPKKGSPGQTVPPGQYAPGIPIPVNAGAGASDRFWINSEDDVVGGWVTDSTAVVFGVPNLAYNFGSGDFSSANYDNGGRLGIYRPNGNVADYAVGLYRAPQFIDLKSNFGNTGTPQAVEDGIRRARQPTKYEVANYTIPTPNDLQQQDLDGGGFDTFGFAVGNRTIGSVEMRSFDFYAPLFGPTEDAMYKGADEVVTAIIDFIKVQEGAMKKYRDSMNKVALSIYSTDPGLYKSAAERISDFNFAGDPTNSNPQSCRSIAGQFLAYYFGDKSTQVKTINAEGCPRSLAESLRLYYNGGLGPAFNPLLYHMDMTVKDTDGGFPPKAPFPAALTGYMPGPLRGGNEKGQVFVPIGGGGRPDNARRSGYSAKFVTLKSLTATDGYGKRELAIYSEGKPLPLLQDIVVNSFRNALDLSALGIPSSVNY